MSGSDKLNDPEIGQMKAILKSWDQDFDSTFELKELKLRQCTDEDIVTAEGQKQTDYGFFPIDRSNTATTDNLASQF